MPESRFTMEDVAALSGVSRASVSRVFRGQGKVSPATIDKVFEAARQLGYVPNQMASELASGGASRAIGLLLRDASNPAYGKLFTELQHAAQDAEIQLISMTISDDDHGRKQVGALNALMGMRVRGLIVATGGVTAEQLDPFRRQLPIIRAGRPETMPLVHAVSYDEVDAGTRIGDYIAERGHRSAVVLRTAEDESFPEWVRGGAVASRLRERGVAVTEIEIRGRLDGIDEALGLVRAGDASVVACPSDMRALELIRAARAAGISIPDDCSVTGMDGIIPGLDLIGLTTVKLNVPELARQTISHLMSLIENPAQETVRTKIRGELISGTTVSDRNA